MPKSGRQTNTVLIVVLIILGASLLCCLGLGFFAWWGIRKVGGFAGCVANYSLTLDAFQKYSQAHDGVLPPAKEWQEAIKPFYEVKSAKKINSFIPMGTPDGNLGCPGGSDGPATGMAYNKAVAGKKIAEITKNGNNPVILFESANSERDQAEVFKQPAGKAPQKVMGNPRDWIWIMWDGTVHGGNQNHGGEVQFGS